MAREKARTDFAEDVAAVKALHRRAVIDFVQWTDDTASKTFASPKLERRGGRCTLHDVDPKALATLPPAVLARPLVGVEVSVDLRVKARVWALYSEQDCVRQLTAGYCVLARRLAPWVAPHVDGRVFRVGSGGQAGVVPSDRVRRRRMASRFPLRGHTAQAIVPYVSSTVEPVYETLYFGEGVEPFWSGRSSDGRAQVRLYIKVTDQGRSLPRRDWRTRVEVTLNDVAAHEALGVRTIGDLLDADLRRLGSTYLMLRRPVRVQAPLPPKGHPAHAMLKRRMAQVATANERAAVTEGNFTQAEAGLVDFKNVPQLTNPIKTALENFSRSTRRHRSKSS